MVLETPYEENELKKPFQVVASLAYQENLLDEMFNLFIDKYSGKTTSNTNLTIK